MPQSAAGWRIDPPVSEPSASGAMPAATATADPPLDPPGIRSSAQGFRVGPNAEFSVDEPIANSSQLVLPTITAPAASSRATAVASNGGTKDSSIRDEAVVRTPRGAEVVLERDRHAGERADRASARGRGRCARRDRAPVRGRPCRRRAAAGRQAPICASAARRPRPRIARRGTASRMSRTEPWGHISDHPRHLEQAGLAVRHRARSPAPRLGRATAARVGRGRRVARDDAGGRAGRRWCRSADLVGVFEDVAQLPREQIELRSSSSSSGERRDRFDLAL